MTDAVATPGAPPAGSIEDRFSADEVEIALRNREMPLEMLREDVTPTGLHYLLNHFDIPKVDPERWTLTIGGLVEHPRQLTLEELGRLEQRTVTATLECAGNGRSFMRPRHEGQPWRWGGVSTATWSGVPLRTLIEPGSISPDVRELVFTGADEGVEEGVEQRFERSLPVDEALAAGVIVATTMNGAPLPPQHGAPARLIVPGWYGMASVKWLSAITAVAEPFDGFQQWGYEARTDEELAGDPCTRIYPRALMVPPGVPGDDGRVLRSRQIELEGRAWSGSGGIERVEVRIDDEPWADADVAPAGSPWAWQRWSASLSLAPGVHELRCRATDATGSRQPDEAPWNVWGYRNNGTQRVVVTVLDDVSGERG
jgi:DMSO/TMAO reductase YedYZ molybdopterin-dependent catalytic subunit